MARRDLSHRDASDRAASELEYIIGARKKVGQINERTVSAEQAMRDKQVFEVKSDREVTRVLFISRDTELLNPTQQSLDGYVDISELFDEVHILILRKGIPPKHPSLRVAKNVWIYTATSSVWWTTPFAGIEMVENELEFANGFRADLIVSRDPFESAVAAYKIGKKYGRSTQLHIVEDYGSTDFVKRSPDNFWRALLTFFTIRKFSSVRVMTRAIQARVQKSFEIPDLEILPKYQNYQALIESNQSIDLKSKYKPFIFFMVYVGYLSHSSTLHRVIDAAQKVLHNTRVGLIVLGDGPARKEFEKRAETLGIGQQVVFETKVSDVVPYLKSANMLIVSDTDKDSEEIVLKGAAVGIPMVMAKTEKREDIFTDTESTFFCEATDTEAFTASIDDLLNNIDLRAEFVSNAQEIMRTKFHHKADEYRSAYRTSIEQAFFADVEEEDSDEE